MGLYPGAPEKTREALLPKLALKPWVQPSTSRPLALLNARVIDPANSCLLDGVQDILIADGKVLSIQPSGAYGHPDSRVIDVRGMFLCPGLIDCHVHVTAVPGAKTMSELMQTPNELINLRSTYVLKEMLLRGFTTVRDTGGASKSLANAIAEGLILGPRLFQSGKALSQTGGHGDFGSPTYNVGCCGGHYQFLGRTCDGVPAVLKATREELKGGADFIKIMCGGGVASETDAIETVQFTAEEIRAITTTCKQMGNKHTTAHAYTNESVLHAINNGVLGIEHGNLIDESTARLMAEKGIFLTPTLSCYDIMVRPPFEDFLPLSGQAKNTQVMVKGLQTLKVAEDAGVIVCFGSDLLTSMHALQTEEFHARSTVLPSPTILKHATTNAAKMLRMTGLLGCISPGSFADILILDANPLEDIRVLDRPEIHLFAVIKEGWVVSSRINGVERDF